MTQEEIGRSGGLAEPAGRACEFRSLPQDWLEQDAIGSYYAAIEEIRRRVRAGEKVPDYLLSKRGEAAHARSDGRDGGGES